jgi:hypothetical protein
MSRTGPASVRFAESSVVSSVPSAPHDGRSESTATAGRWRLRLRRRSGALLFRRPRRRCFRAGCGRLPMPVRPLIARTPPSFRASSPGGSKYQRHRHDLDAQQQLVILVKCTRRLDRTIQRSRSARVRSKAVGDSSHCESRDGLGYPCSMECPSIRTQQPTARSGELKVARACGDQNECFNGCAGTRRECRA